MRNNNSNVLSGNNSGNINGSSIDSGQIYSASFQAVFTDAAAAGTVKIQGSNDITNVSNIPADFTPTNWTDIASGSAAVAAGASVLITLPNLNYRWLRVVWTRSAGAGTINVNMNSQGF